MGFVKCYVLADTAGILVAGGGIVDNIPAPNHLTYVCFGLCFLKPQARQMIGRR